jgi:UDP-N-acetylglucosamine/UDP-N-acetylgalactosamine diphosphorylase
MSDVPADLLGRLRAHGQEHVLHGWDRLSEQDQRSFIVQLASIDLDEIASLYQRKNEPEYVLPPLERIQPIPVADASVSPSVRALGEEALRLGEVAALIVAGGQGSRLGFDKPKGMYPVGPVSQATLFQIHAEKVAALGRRHGKAIPLLIMTSPATDAETRAFFQEHRFFGLDPASMTFFQQGTMPAVSAATGQLLLEGPGRLFMSPNGHGGTLTALAEQGVLSELKARGIRHVYYCQVDNPLLKICDPDFLGSHIQGRSEASSKVVFKEKPEEKVGVLALLEGKCGIIEYIFLPRAMAEERDAAGNLLYRAGSPAIHLFTLEFLERVISTSGLPFHIAQKAVIHWDPASRQTIDPGKTPNALKFERFIFDALPLAERYLAMETRRSEEFSPLKNATGADSPETVKADQSALHTRWLEQAGGAANGFPLEISPLFALDAEELASKIRPGHRLTGPTYLR